jgi:hypothetical protein
MKKYISIIAALILGACSQGTQPIELDRTATWPTIVLDSFSRLEVSTWNFHRYAERHSTYPGGPATRDTLEVWSQLDMSDTLLSFPVTPGDSGLRYEGKKNWDVTSGMSQSIRNYSCSALFSLDSLRSLASLRVTVSDYKHEHGRVDIIIDRSLFNLRLDSMTIASSNADSLVFHAVVDDRSTVEYWEEKEYGYSWILHSDKYLGSRSPTVVRVVLKR